MSRLLSTLTLLSQLLLAAAPAFGVMVRDEKTAVPDFFGSSFESASGDEWPVTQYSTRGGVDCSYETALDVRDGPNLYAYVMQNPWSKWDPDGLWWRDALSAGLDFIPVVSTIKTAVEFVAGQDLITGEAISRAESAAGLGASFIPGGKGAMKIAKMGAKMADKAFEIQGKAETLVAAAEEVSDGGKVSLATAAGLGMEIIAGKKGKGDFKGGAHSKMQEPGIESHHMPAKSVSGLGEPDGPAIQMDPSDHKLTRSHQHRQGSGEYREMIGDMIAGGDMRGAMATEIRDVRRVARQVGDPSKYNRAMRQMMKYAREENEGKRNFIPKNPQTKVERTK